MLLYQQVCQLLLSRGWGHAAFNTSVDNLMPLLLVPPHLSHWHCKVASLRMGPNIPLSHRAWKPVGFVTLAAAHSNAVFVTCLADSSLLAFICMHVPMCLLAYVCAISTEMLNSLTGVVWAQQKARSKQEKYILMSSSQMTHSSVDHCQPEYTKLEAEMIKCIFLIFLSIYCSQKSLSQHVNWEQDWVVKLDHARPTYGLGYVCCTRGH